MHTAEILLAFLSGVVNARLARRSRIAWLVLTAWTVLSLSTVAADATRIFEWLPGVAWFRAAGVIWFVVSIRFSQSHIFERTFANRPEPPAISRTGRCGGLATHHRCRLRHTRIAARCRCA